MGGGGGGEESERRLKGELIDKNLSSTSMGNPVRERGKKV